MVNDGSRSRKAGPPIRARARARQDRTRKRPDRLPEFVSDIGLPFALRRDEIGLASGRLIRRVAVTRRKPLSVTFVEPSAAKRWKELTDFLLIRREPSRQYRRHAA